VVQPNRRDLRERIDERYRARRNLGGIPPFSEALKAVIWPKSFRTSEIKSYDGKADPEHWITLYEVAVQAAGGDEYVMANYLPVVLDNTVTTWLLRQRPGSIHSWAQLRQMFIDHFKPTCVQPGSKYALKQIRLRPKESLRQYIRRFSETWNRVTDISPETAVDAFINGLVQPRGHDLQKALLLRQPRTMEDLFSIAHDYALLDDGMNQGEEGPSHRYRRRNDDSDDESDVDRPPRRQHDRRRDQRFKRRGQDNYDGRQNRGRNSDSVNAVKGKQSAPDEALEKILAQDCPRHPGKGHTMGECRVLTEALVKSNKRPRPNPKPKPKPAD
jgi:hypothetical protein